MAGDTDFVALYHELGLGADCALPDLKRAYRRRVGELHPDRAGDDPVAMRALQDLNALYSNAMEFHRRHGRLPGASAPVASAPGPAPRPSTSSHPAPPARASRRGVPAAIALLIVAVLAWSAWPRAGEDGLPAAAVHAEPRADTPREATAGRTMALGSAMALVRTLHGDPVSGWEKRWEYGPSWVAFRCGMVSDWYSSPLRPLKVATPRPAASRSWSPPKHCKE